MVVRIDGGGELGCGSWEIRGSMEAFVGSCVGVEKLGAKWEVCQRKRDAGGRLGVRGGRPMRMVVEDLRGGVETGIESGDEAWEGLKDILPFDVLRSITKPARYLGNERGAVSKDWDSCDVRMCLAYPEMYEIGMSNTGHVILYSCVNDENGVLCDRSYLPGPDMGAALRDAGKSLFAVESKKPLSSFDIVAVPVHYEMGATNCLQLLSLAGIPINRDDRQDAGEKPFDVLDGSYPLVFAGGQTVTANPEPFADFFDFFALGDGEDTLPLVARKVLEYKKLGLTRDEVLLRLAQEVPGIYVPQFYARNSDGSVRRTRDDVPARPQRQVATPQPERALSLVPYITTIHDRLTIEIRRGCTRGCRFCLPGNLNRPARDVEPEKVVKGVLDGVQNSGYREFSLLSLSCSDWLSLPAIGIELKNTLREHKTSIQLSLPSQRVDRFDENIATLVAGGEEKRSGITFAPEAGTQRMRDVINKGLTNEDLLRGVKTAYMQGYAQVKLYFMIGLPGETDDDVIGIVETVKWLQRECKVKGRQRVGIKLTISNFTPKPHTPFQWHSVSKEEFERKQRLLKGLLKSQRDIKFNFTDARISAMEDFLGRADRRAGSVIRKAWEKGSTMDDWWMDLDGAYRCWKDAIHECGLSWEYRKTEEGEWNVAETPQEGVKGKRGWYDVARQQELEYSTLTPKAGWKSSEADDPVLDQDATAAVNPLDRPLPWDHIDGGLDKGWLRDELMKALTESLTPDCAFEECSSCGVCGDDFGNNVVIPPPPIPEFAGHYRPEWTKEQKIRARFTRSGSGALLSHLDVNRLLDRALLRAGINISFTNGFNQQPRFQPAQPLPLGFTSEAEVYDFELANRMDVDEFSGKLGAQLPSTFALGEAEEMPVGSPYASAALSEVQWIVLLAGCGERTSASVIDAISQSGPVLVERTSKRRKNKQTVDLKSLVESVETVTTEETQPILTHLGVSNWDPDFLLVKYSARIMPESFNLNPGEFARMVGIVLGEDVQLRHAHKSRVRLDREKSKPVHDDAMEPASL